MRKFKVTFCHESNVSTKIKGAFKDQPFIQVRVFEGKDGWDAINKNLCTQMYIVDVEEIQN